jgi:hypothetical protein
MPTCSARYAISAEVAYDLLVAPVKTKCRGHSGGPRSRSFTGLRWHPSHVRSFPIAHIALRLLQVRLVPKKTWRCSLADTRSSDRHSEQSGRDDHRVTLQS